MGSGLDNVVRFINEHEKIIITSHESPDADGLGASVAFYELLQKLGRKCHIVMGDPTPEKIKFIDPDNEITLAESFTIPEDIRDYSLVVLDTNSFTNTGNAYRVLSPFISNAFIIDHHEGGEDFVADHFVKVEASSASEIIFEIYRYFNIELSYKAAMALYTGILFDTGAFKYKKTASNTLYAAGAMIKAGVKPYEVFEKLFENNDLQSFLLRCKMLSTVEIHFDGALVLMHLTPAMIKETGSDFSIGEGNINIPLSVSGVHISVLLKQDIEGPLKVSMRTKGDLDVSEIAIKNGGGGHRNAAGFKSKKDRVETRQELLVELEGLLRSNNILK